MPAKENKTKSAPRKKRPAAAAAGRARVYRLAGNEAPPQSPWPAHPHDRKVTVIIPVLNESKRISSVVELALKSRRVLEVIVVDDGSIDGTPELAETAGARVITSSMLGKGASMEDGLIETKTDCILYLDGDLAGLAHRTAKTSPFRK